LNAESTQKPKLENQVEAGIVFLNSSRGHKKLLEHISTAHPKKPLRELKKVIERILENRS